MRPTWRCLVVALLAALAGATNLAPAHAQRCPRDGAAGLLALDVDRYTVLGYVPESAVGTPAPLVVNLHPTGGTGLRTLKASRRVADEEGFAMIAPTGAIGPIFSGWTWNVPGVPTFGVGTYPPAEARDEVVFISRAIEAMKKEACIDARRVYVIGYSGGGRMASRLACDLSAKIAAVAPIGGLRFSKESDRAFGLPKAMECAPSRPMPIKAIHGHFDPINVWYESDLGETTFRNLRTGGNWVVTAPKRGTSWSYAGETALARWVAANGCSAAPTTTQIADAVERRDYRDCRDGGDVSLVLFKDMGHAIPGHPSGAMPGQEGASDIDGFALAWDLLQNHRLPE